jgi:chlorobactene glucosyltransferase
MNSDLIIIPALLIMGFTLLQWFIAMLNYVFRVDYNHYATRQKELVSVVVPARNEEANIGNLLDDLAMQTYDHVEIIVANDDSTDKTAEIAGSYAGVTLIDAGLKTDGWLGKNHACYKASKLAKGKYLLFLDADVRLGRTAIASAVGYFEHSGIVLLSVFPQQLMHNKGVYRVVPLMNYILLSLLVLPLVKWTRFVSMSAANGQFMLFDRELYTALEPHKQFRNEKVEDIHISRYYKRNGYRIACVTGNRDIACSMYSTYEQAIEGFSKNVFAFFGNSVVAGLLFWIIALTGIFWMMALPWYALVIYSVAVISTRWLISTTSRQSIFTNIVMHYAQLITLGKLMFRALQHQRKKNYQWKGRSVY